jgi:GMP synthase-like glutamine amidotransferase
MRAMKTSLPRERDCELHVYDVVTTEPQHPDAAIVLGSRCGMNSTLPEPWRRMSAEIQRGRPKEEAG